MHILYRLIEVLLFPPGSLILIGLFGWYVVKRRLHRGRILIICSVLLMWLFSTPLVSFTLLDSLQNRYPQIGAVPENADAIVVLGAGREFGASEFGRDQDISVHGLIRLRYAAYLARQTGLPLIVSGGQVWNRPGTEAELAKQILSAEYGLLDVVEEPNSKTTLENAARSAEILNSKGWEYPLLVTEYWHMPRAMYSFNKFGVEALAAPTGRDTPDVTEQGVWALMPQAQSMERSRVALHEWLGRLWYWMRF